MCVAVVAMACTKNETHNIVPENKLNMPSVVNASFESQTRTVLQWEDGKPKTYWSVGDKIAVYNNEDKKSYAYQLSDDFQLPTRSGIFEIDENSGVRSGSCNIDYDKVVAFYPYYPYDDVMRLYEDNEQLYFSSGIDYIQKFAGHNTYAIDSNPMLAVAEPGSANLEFKNLFGYLKITLSGDYSVKSIILSGNNEELLAGGYSMRSDDPYNAVIESDGYEAIILDCGDGVTLTGEGVSFIFVLPPITLEKGFTIQAIDSNGNIHKKSTKNSVTISRNVIQPAHSFCRRYGVYRIANHHVYS